MAHVTINGKDLESRPNQTILEVAREQGFFIPTLCHHEALEPFGACRLCVVEVQTNTTWRLVTSCTYPCSDGLVVQTDSEGVLRSRRMTVELMMASASQVPLIQQLAEEFEVGPPRFTMPQSDCILCGLCVRACKEIVGVDAISVINRGLDKMISPPFHIASNTCIECGTCVLICPTGAITFDDITGGASTVHKIKSEFQALPCRLCGQSHMVPKFIDHAALLAEADPALPAGEKESLR